MHLNLAGTWKRRLISLEHPPRGVKQNTSKDADMLSNKLSKGKENITYVLDLIHNIYTPKHTMASMKDSWILKL